MNVYIPILVLGLLALGFSVFSVTAATFTGPKRYNRAKYDAYECGIEPTPQPIGGGRFPVKYYLTGGPSTANSSSYGSFFFRIDSRDTTRYSRLSPASSRTKTRSPGLNSPSR